MKKRVLVGIGLFMALTLVANDFYFSVDGKDTNSGLSADSPRRSLSGISDLNLKPGDRVLLKGGDKFSEAMSLSNQYGTDAKPIVISSYGEGKAIISGSVSINNWQSKGKNIWEAVVPSEVFQLFRDDTVLTTARIPKIKGKYAGEDNFYHITSVVNSNYSFISEDLIGAPDITGATLHVGTWEWLLKTAEIASFDSSTGKVTVKTDIFDVFAKDNRFFINNHKNLLTKEGDWVYDGTNKKLILFSTSYPEKMAGAIMDGDGISISGGAYVSINKLKVQHFNENGIYSSRTENLSIQDCFVDYNYKRGIYTKDSESTILEQCEVTGTTLVGILNYNKNSKINNCFLHDIGLQNQLNRVGFGTGCGIRSFGLNDSISNNLLVDIGYNGVELNYRTFVKNNVVKYVNLTSIDGGAIYSYHGIGGVIEDNVVIGHPAIAELRSHGIYIDNVTHDTHISGNTVKSFNNNIFVNKNAYNISIKNNTSYGALNAGFLVTTATGIVFKNNAIFNSNAKVPPMYVQGISDWSHFESDSNLFYNTSGFVTAFIYGDGYYGLGEWVKKSGNDKNSEENKMLIPEFGMTTVNKNAILESNFEASPTGWSYWSSTAKLVNKGSDGTDKCIYDTLSSGRTLGNMFIKNIELENGKDYLLEFEMKTNRTSLAQIDFISENGYKYLDKHRIFVKPDWQQYSIVIKNITQSSLNAQLAFYCAYSDWMHSTPNAFFIDNVKLTECVLDESEQHYTLVYNESSEATNIQINGAWHDLEGNIFNDFIKLKAFDSRILIKESAIEAKLTFSKGWNIFSFPINPESQDLVKVLQPLIATGDLLKVQDQTGNTMEYLGTSFGWVNQIPKIDVNKAYKVKVNRDCEIYYRGYPHSADKSIPLLKGWNLLPYLKEEKESAALYLKPLIDGKVLIKAVDEAGNTLEKINGDQWLDKMEDLGVGQGCRIKVNKDTVFNLL